MENEEAITGRDGKNIIEFWFGIQNEGTPSNAEEPEDVTAFFTDSNLKEAVKEALDGENAITKTACAAVTELNVGNKNIESLEGIKY